MPRILIVDDDPALRDIVRFALAQEGWQTAEAADGVAALEAAVATPPDLVVLDVMMPALDGIEVCRRLRRQGDVPIVFLSARDDEVDRVLGLEMGGDDYVGKPFSPRELVARIKAVLRRRAGPRAQRPVMQSHGRLALDHAHFAAHWDGRAVVLTATEFGILAALMDRPGHVLSRDRLMETGYAEERIVADRTIDSHIRRLRQKFAALGAEPIETVHGVGYRLGPC